MESCSSNKLSADRYSARLRRQSQDSRTSGEIHGDPRSSMDSAADGSGNILSIDIELSDHVRDQHLEPRTLDTTRVMDLVHSPLWLWCSHKRALVWSNASARMLDSTQAKPVSKDRDCTDKGKVSFVEMRLQAVENGECIVFLQGAAMRLFPMPTAAVDGDEIVEVVAKPYRFKDQNGNVTPCCLLEVVERLNPDTARDLEMLYEAPMKTLLFDTSGKLLTKGRQMGSSMSELFTSDGEEFLRDMVRRLFDEGENHIFSHHEVGERWLSLDIQASRDPVTYSPAILVNINDITDMKRAELELMRENISMAEHGNDLKAENTRLQERLVRADTRGDHRRLSLNTETPADIVHDLLSRLASGRKVSISAAQTVQRILWECDGDIHSPIDLHEHMTEGEDAGMSIAQMLNAPRALVTDTLSKKWRRASLDAIPSDVTHRAIRLTGQWDFDSFGFAAETRGRPLSTLGAWVLEKEGLVAQYNLDVRKLCKFLRRVEDGYPDNPYHSRIHAAAVLHMTYMLISQAGVMKTAFEPETVMCCYLAAIMHDYKHPGLTAEHLVNRRSSLALRYNDRSPLENHHISSAWRLLLLPECNFLGELSDDVYRGIRDMTIDLVLSTDMQHHFSIMSRFKRSASHSRGAESTNSSKEMLEDSTSRLVQQMIVKVADLSHVAAPTEQHRKWVALLQEEHWRQGDLERSLGMSVSHMMNREGGGITDSQVGFFEIIVLPTFEAFSNCFEGARVLHNRVQCNYWYWRGMVKKQLNHRG